MFRFLYATRIPKTTSETLQKHVTIQQKYNKGRDTMLEFECSWVECNWNWGISWNSVRFIIGRFWFTWQLCIHTQAQRLFGKRRATMYSPSMYSPSRYPIYNVICITPISKKYGGLKQGKVWNEWMWQNHDLRLLFSKIGRILEFRISMLVEN